MYFGVSTPELEKVRVSYEEIFGHDPNGEMELEFDEYDDYLSLLLQCIKEKRDMFDVLEECH